MKELAVVNATNTRLERELERVQRENDALRERVRKVENNTGPLDNK